MTDRTSRPGLAPSPHLGPRPRKPLDPRWDNVLPFRHKGPAVRYRRRHPLIRMAGPFGGALLLVGIPSALAFWLLTTPRLALAALTVESDPSVLGTTALPSDRSIPERVRRVSRSWIERTVRPFLGVNLLRLRLEAVAASVGKHPWVALVETRKELPHRLRIRVRERSAAALLHDGDKLFYVDSSGAVIAPLEADDPPVDLVVISRAPPARSVLEGARKRAIAGGLGIIGELAAVRPEWAAQLSEIEILGMEDYRLVIANLPFPLLVRAGTLAGRIRKLESLVPQIAARYGTVAAVDLRFARRIIVQPAEAITFVRS